MVKMPGGGDNRSAADFPHRYSVREIENSITDQLISKR
jgi:hypothetical protein